MTQHLCCVCHERIWDVEASAFGACDDCLDDVLQDPEAFLETCELGTRPYQAPALSHGANASPAVEEAA